MMLSYEAVLTVLKSSGCLLHAGKGAQQGAHSFRGVFVDSRKMEAGGIFVAFRGISSDSHTFIPGLAAKAGLFIVENEAAMQNVDGDYLVVRNGREAWALLAAASAGNPQQRMRFLGVTGTNGKTSCVWLLKEFFASMGVKALCVGTLGAYLDGKKIETGHTTPDPDRFYPLLEQALAAGIDTVCMEVSSHGIAQAKIAPLRFDAVAWTSFSRDHLDFHPTMEDYWSTKKRLFLEFLQPAAKKIATFDVAQKLIAEGVPVSAKLCSFQEKEAKTDVCYEIMDESPQGTKLRISMLQQEMVGVIPFFGRHNCENFAIALYLSAVRAGSFLAPDLWPGLKQIPGRLERVSSLRSRVHVFVDFAHTPDAIRVSLGTLRKVCTGRLVIVFGCGGDRDRGKRPEMAAMAEQMADFAFVTSDNPRSENPVAIISDVLSGFSKAARYSVEEDREQAIRCAIESANPGDLLVIAGKGHEDYQDFGTHKIPFDDRVVAKKYLESSAT